MLDWAAATTLIVERLQSSGTADYPATEITNALNYALAEFSKYHPHKVGILFKLEGRAGRATSTSADNLVDTTSGQFVAGDATDEKVIHNTTDYTWAAVLSQASTAQIGISSDIMAVNELYEIYNKRCTSHRQIFIGDVPNNYQVLATEYPIGTKRNWKQDGDILELDVDHVPDTNSNTAKISNPANADVMVRFGVSHVLPNLTDWAATFTSTAAVSATSVALTALQSAGTINTGTEFTIENHRSTYVVAASAAIASSAVSLTFYPPLESAVASTGWALTFKKTSLDPKYEDMVVDIAVGKAMINRAPEFFNSINIGGGVVYQNFLTTGEGKLAEALAKLKESVPPRISHRYPMD